MSPTDCTRVDGAPAGPGSFAVRSATESGHVWYVELIHPECVWCACERFTRTQECRHTDAAAALWRREHEQHLAAVRSDPVAMAAASRRVKEIQEMFR